MYKMEIKEMHQPQRGFRHHGGRADKGTRFRSLSLNIAKPLFPLAGFPMVHHPILACKKIPNLAHIYLIGFYDERLFTLYLSNVSSELKILVRYLCEDKPHGSAGALFKFRDLLMEGNPNCFLLRFPEGYFCHAL